MPAQDRMSPKGQVSVTETLDTPAENTSPVASPVAYKNTSAASIWAAPFDPQTELTKLSKMLQNDRSKTIESYSGDQREALEDLQLQIVRQTRTSKDRELLTALSTPISYIEPGPASSPGLAFHAGEEW